MKLNTIKSLLYFNIESTYLLFNFILLPQFDYANSSSECYSSIMIITDGSTDIKQEVMNSYMEGTKRQVLIYRNSRIINNYLIMVLSVCSRPSIPY